MKRGTLLRRLAGVTILITLLLMAFSIIGQAQTLENKGPLFVEFDIIELKVGQTGQKAEDLTTVPIESGSIQLYEKGFQVTVQGETEFYMITGYSDAEKAGMVRSTAGTLFQFVLWNSGNEKCIIFIHNDTAWIYFLKDKGSPDKGVLPQKS